MKEILKRFCALLCLVAMLSFVSTPVFGGENPWDSDNDSSDASDSGSGTGGSGSDPDQPMYLGAVYIGADGLLTLVSHGVNYLFTFISHHGRRAIDRPESRTETSQQGSF